MSTCKWIYLRQWFHMNRRRYIADASITYISSSIFENIGSLVALFGELRGSHIEQPFSGICQIIWLPALIRMLSQHWKNWPDCKSRSYLRLYFLLELWCFTSKYRSFMKCWILFNSRYRSLSRNFITETKWIFNCTTLTNL